MKDSVYRNFLVLFVSLLRKGEKLQDIEPGIIAEFLQNANAAGALACTKAGAIPALPTGEEVDRFKENNKQ